MSGPYKFFLVLHLLAVIAGIGTTVLNGVYGAKAKAAGPNGGHIAKANFEVTMIAEKIIYLIPIFGIILVAISPNDIWGFDQFWIWGSLVLYVIALGIAHGVMVPSSKRMLALGAKMGSGQGGPADVAEMEMIGKRLASGGMTLNLLVVILVVLMVWKPGV
jgi:hypothetical protein